MISISPSNIVVSVCFLLGTAVNVMPTLAQDTSFRAAHIERSASVALNGTPEEVFPLLEPRGRQERATSWTMEFLYPRSGDAQPGSVTRQAHRSGAVEQIWLLAEHDPPNRIKYVIFVP